MKSQNSSVGQTRREFLKQVGAVTAFAAGHEIPSVRADESRGDPAAKTPWYRRMYRWGQTNITVSGPGLIDCELYQQGGRLIPHLVNLTSAGTWRAPVHESIAVGPLHVRIRLPENLQPKTLKMLVSGENRSAVAEKGWVPFERKSILDHEVVVLES